MRQRSRLAKALVTLVAGIGCAASFASPYDHQVDVEDFEEERVYSPYAGREYPDQVLFGDTHSHTDLSFDAGLIGTTLDVDAGYRFARGEEVLSNTGQPVQLVRPLDFLVITDHAELIGLAPMIRESDSALLSDPWGRKIYDLFNSGPEGRMQAFQMVVRDSVGGENPLGAQGATRSIWVDFVEKAETYNEPGRFTAMTGFEWTSTPNGDNLHRVVIQRDGADKTSQTLPYSQFDSADPEDLWKYLAAYEQKTGGQAIAIPHNGNLSNGLMFARTTFTGQAMTRDYAERRMRWEPLLEVSQMKGTGETHPLLSPEDEFADFEIWDVSNLAGTVPKQEKMLQHEYARPALKLGLELGQNLGANPFKYGMGAGSDTHTALATTREENYFGKYRNTEPSPNRFDHEVISADDEALRIVTS